MSDKRTVVLHAKLDDGGHWFCCGAGEQFSSAASDLVDARTLTALLPLVEVYARARMADELRQAAGGPERDWDDRLRRRADEIEDAR